MIRLRIPIPLLYGYAWWMSPSLCPMGYHLAKKERSVTGRTIPLVLLVIGIPRGAVVRTRAELATSIGIAKSWRGTRTNIALRSLISPSAIRKDVIMIAYLATGTHGARALFLVVVTTLLPDTREDLFSEKNSIMALARLSLWMSSVASKHVLLIVSSACGLSGVRAQLHAVTLVPGYLKITEYIPVAMYPVVPVTSLPRAPSPETHLMVDKNAHWKSRNPRPAMGLCATWIVS